MKDKNIEEIRADIEKVLKGLKSGTLSLEKAESVIACTELIVETFSMQYQYHELRKETNDALPTKSQIETAKKLIAEAKEEIKKRGGTPLNPLER